MTSTPIDTATAHAMPASTLTAVAGGSLSERVARAVDQQEIADVIYRYCRGIDRCDFDLVRSCYHADATDDHGDFRGGVDDFIAFVRAGLTRFERTMHFVGNLLVEVRGDTARVESYVIAHHHMRASNTKPERDFNVGLRYVDDFERRSGEWRIAARVCVFDWWRIDPVLPGNWLPLERSALGRRDGGDASSAQSIAEWDVWVG
jgi:ketosteroid isomerase-like protein